MTKGTKFLSRTIVFFLMSIIISDINAYAVDDTNAIWENGKIVTDERIFEKEIDEISYLSFAKERKEFVYHYVLD